jgi:hypothetical protein
MLISRDIEDLTAVYENKKKRSIPRPLLTHITSPPVISPLVYIPRIGVKHEVVVQSPEYVVSRLYIVLAKYTESFDPVSDECPESGTANVDSSLAR